ncbi:MAG TPA: hypothetical protein VGH04_00890 [Gemmatimonadaceae bacterium]|jgi:hypothetical protein
MSHARYQPPDHSKGDESTIGGYAAVHDRPAAFEGSDGFSYSVEIMAERSGSDWRAFFLFIKWARIGAQTPEGHVESDYLASGATEQDARDSLGRTSLDEVKALLDRLIAERRVTGTTRRWWDAMRDQGGEESE